MKPEIIEGLPFAQYEAIDAEHSGTLRKILTSPLAYKVARDEEKAGLDHDSDAMRLGRASHTAILEPSLFTKSYTCWSGKARRGKDWEAFESECVAAGVTVLLEKQLDRTVRLSKAVRAHPVSGPIVTAPGRSELTILWTHPRTGIRIKCRLDRLNPDLFVDLKTTRDPSPALFSSQCARMGYHFQLALYSDAVAAAGLGAIPCQIVAVQSSSPFDVVVYDVDEDTLSKGRTLYETALDKLIECQASGKWPGQAVEGPVMLHLPMWAAQDFSEDAPDESSPIEDAAF